MSIKGENFLGGNMSHLLQALIKRLEGACVTAVENDAYVLLLLRCPV